MREPALRIASAFSNEKEITLHNIQTVKEPILPLTSAFESLILDDGSREGQISSGIEPPPEEDCLRAHEQFLHTRARWGPCCIPRGIFHSCSIPDFISGNEPL